jgi:peptide chain release factor 3
MSELQQEINKRLTFAIISHPDAGKTTITEKLLLFGGAIHAAGAVKSKKTEKRTTSDFMQMEVDRGISISTSVMGFDYKNRKVNLLDTPGHEDFSEDTYRTLTAVDSALMVIDSVKGVEERTRKLCEICRMRHTPIITFLNKLDREGKEPISVLDEVEKELNIYVSPMTWPVGQGQQFKGVYSFTEKRIILFDAHDIQSEKSLIIGDIYDEALDKAVGAAAAAKLRDDVAMVEGVYPPFNREDYLNGLITPVFFGSALNNFGIRELLDAFAELAPAPQGHAAEERQVMAAEEKFSGFIFKIHANLDPKHRDRIAFMRICSGTFEKNRQYLHSRSGKPYRTNAPTAFMAQSRDIIDKAYPGDIIGLHDSGLFKIGDSLTEGEKLTFKGIPAFAPQLFRKVINKDPLKSKQFAKGLEQLSEEGVIQVFTHRLTKTKLIGAVGVLQLEVTQYRLANEYGASCLFEGADFNIACWVKEGNDKADWQRFTAQYENRLAVDAKGNTIFLAASRWVLDRTIEENKNVVFSLTSEFT